MENYPKIRLFVETRLAAGMAVTLSDKQAHYLLHVMRVKSGERLALFNGEHGEWLAEVNYFTKKEVGVKLLDQLREPSTGPDAWLVFAPIKHESIDYLAEKATELGVSELRPVFTRHTSVGRVNVDRLRANAIEAAEQCERVSVPQVHAPQTLQNLLAEWPADRRLFYGDERGGGAVLKEILPGLKHGPWALLIGPEGGFAPDELTLLKSLPYATGIGLGPRVMRAETAAVAALACLQCWLGDWQQQPSFRNG